MELILFTSKFCPFCIKVDYFIDEHEFNQTFNLSTREIQSNNNYNLAGFTTSSYFKPYVTTIGLYNEEGDKVETSYYITGLHQNNLDEQRYENLKKKINKYIRFPFYYILE